MTETLLTAIGQDKIGTLSEASEAKTKATHQVEFSPSHKGVRFMFARRRLLSAGSVSGLAIAFALLAPSAVRAEGPFTGMAGAWSGPGSITVNGKAERLRCRASYDVKNTGATVDLSIRCASDSYKFELQGGVNYVNGSVSGTWSESAHGAAGTISGTVKDGIIRVSAAGPYFSALLSMNTRGTTQSIALNSPGSQISSVTIQLAKGR